MTKKEYILKHEKLNVFITTMFIILVLLVVVGATIDHLTFGIHSIPLIPLLIIYVIAIIIVTLIVSASSDAIDSGYRIYKRR